MCRMTATDFNNLELVYSKPPPKSESLQYGLSPLHAWIRVFEFLLHIGYKNDPAVRQWRIAKSSEAARITECRKKRIQDEIRQKIGLLVDVVRPNAGTTNDGNTARTAFSDKYRSTFAEILGVEQWLVDDFQIVLVALSCGLPIDTEKYAIFCRNLATKYVNTYKWHPMTVTVHKILIHGHQVMECAILPVGMLSEQAGESRNKFWRYDREHHCRKSDRIKTMSDLFHRASSDPVISGIRLSQRIQNSKKLALPKAV